MRKVLIAISYLMIFIFIISQTHPVYAYDKENNHYEDSAYYVTREKNETTPNQVTLYLLIPKDCLLEGVFWYDFNGYSKENFPDCSYFDILGFGTIRYEVRVDTYNSIAEVGDGQLIQLQFQLENGTYCFSTNDYNNNTVILNSKLENPLNHKIDYSTEESINRTIINEMRTINNEAIILYGIHADEEFINNNASALAEYARTGNTYIENTEDIKNNLTENITNLIDDDNITSDEIEALVGGLLQEEDVVSPTVAIDETPTKSNIDTVEITNSSDNKEDITESIIEKDKTNNNKKDIRKIILIILIFIVGFILLDMASKNRRHK